MGKKNIRVTKLIDTLMSYNKISIGELAKLFDVSEMTIRRDLKELQEKNIVSLYEGIVCYNKENAQEAIELSKEYDLSFAADSFAKEKEVIGAFAATLIEPNDSIILDTGSTIEAVANSVPLNFPFSALCSSLNMLQILSKKPNVYLSVTGGFFHPKSRMLECDQSVDFIKSCRSHKVFLSAAGIHKTLGVTCVNNYEVSTKKACIEASLEKILCVDYSKFDNLQSAFFCDLDSIDTVITNKALSVEWQDFLNSKDIKLFLV